MKLYRFNKEEKIFIRDNSKELINDELKKDRVMFPMEKYNYMLITYIFLIIFTVIKGSEHSKSLIGVIP